MFCKKCGKEIREGDQFCGECGCPVDGSNERNYGTSQHENTYKVEVKIPSLNLNGCRILDLAKIYLLRPLSFFSEFKNCANAKTSIALALVLPILYGLICITYTQCIISSFFSGMKKIPDILAKSGIIEFDEAVQLKSQLIASNELLAFKSQVKNMIDIKNLFFNDFLYLLGIIVVTAMILTLINIVILKAKINVSDIFFISSVSYVPLVLSVVLASLASFISITLGIIIVVSGYILSFITLYSGIRQFTDEKNDKIFMAITILFLIISIILSITVTKKIESSLSDIMNYIKTLESIL